MFALIQANGLLVSKVKTFKEIFLDFLAVESNVFHFDKSDALEKLYGINTKDPQFTSLLGRKLASVCISLNEHPSIRYQGSSPYAKEIATSLHQTILSYKRNNPSFWTYGDDNIHHERERGQILILDRSFDCLSPLMHEYTYQAMANDLLNVEDGVISYTTTTNKGTEEKQAVLNESDEFWLELRHSHIAKVIEVIKERMNDIIQNNSGAALAKKSGADLDITAMAAAVKKLPEYTQTMTKLGQHVAIAQQCMDAFSKQGLLDLSQVEQTISTGLDEEFKEVKGSKLLTLVTETLKKNLKKEQRIRLLAIYYVSQKNVPGSEEHIQLALQAAKLSESEKVVFTNFTRLLGAPEVINTAPGAAKGGVFSFFGGKTTKHSPTPEGEYADTRHVCLLKILLEQIMSNTLPMEKFPAMGPAAANTTKTEAKSVRKFGAASKFGKKDNIQLSGVRYMCFVAGGVSYAELRSGYEMMQKESKEVIIGGTHLITPESYLVDVGALNSGRTTNREDLI